MKLLKLSILVVNGVSSCLFFFLSDSTAAAAYIFTALNCTTTIISLGPRALSAEFQHFILRFNKMSLLCGYQRTGGERRPKDRVKTGLFYRIALLYGQVVIFLRVEPMVVEAALGRKKAFW